MVKMDTFAEVSKKNSKKMNIKRSNVAALLLVGPLAPSCRLETFKT